MRKQKPTAILPGDDATPMFAEQTRLNDIDNGFSPWSFGGSTIDVVEGVGVQDIPNFREVRVAANQQALTDGPILTAHVWLRMDQTFFGGTITPEIWDVTGTPVLLVSGSSQTTTLGTWVRQSILLPPHPASIKYYRLRVSKSVATGLWYVYGTLERSVP